MRVFLRTIAVLLLVVGVPMAWFAPATADAPTMVGWWFKLNAAESPAPAPPAAPVPAPTPVPVEVGTRPPNVPEGGLYIANDPSGPAAVAAVQLMADEGATGTLTLQVADGGTGEPLIAACPAVGVWEPAEGGSWDKRPEADCSAGKVVGTVGDDGSVTFALDPSLAAPGGAGYDLVLLPDPDSGTPFQTPFEAPGDDAWAPQGGTSESVAGDLGSAGGDFAAEPASGGAGEGSFDSGTGSVDSGGGGDLGTDFSSGDAGGSIDVGTPPLDAGTAGEAPGAPQTAVDEEVGAPAAQPVADDDNARERLIAIGLLVALAAALFWVSNRAGAAVGDAAPAGVGRFARPRSGRPNGLT